MDRFNSYLFESQKAIKKHLIEHHLSYANAILKQVSVFIKDSREELQLYAQGLSENKLTFDEFEESIAQKKSSLQKGYLEFEFLVNAKKNGARNTYEILDNAVITELDRIAGEILDIFIVKGVLLCGSKKAVEVR